MTTPDEDFRHLAAAVADDIRPLMQEELLKAWHDGVKTGLGMARHIAETARDRDALLSALAQTASEVESTVIKSPEG